uniref:Methyltransferase domain-containing protein n=1 Tax=Candidatus Kentrum sp. FM TaxID=2126340 RepID=A0A450WIB4_9GAMM|nr:MAG: Methyltransferase domain-containing protein [Candidatus Kentron sp. FM]VFJ67799.1 MAG: Methyltransferase domain-containing protein [Candidatus Kentron sp. FM]VFK16771.1 MAG: Methyltransferase domain-containing protein [Candidatus Kentron sp. FM]
MKADKEIIEQLYRAETPREIAGIYDRWAKTYDSDLTEDSDYVAPRRCLELLKKYVPSGEARILDVGAGTGLFGQLLHRNGYRDITGVDISEGMLTVAREKGVYRELYRAVLGEPLGFPSGTFDAAIAVGVFSPGQGPPNAFDELIRIVKPGGYFLFTIRPEFCADGKFGFEPKQRALEEAGKWTLEEKTERFQGLPKGEPDLFYNVWVYRIT